MTDLRQAAQQALEALESLQGGCTDHNDGTVEAITVWCPEVIDALRTALEQQAEPVSQAVIAGALFDFMGWLTTRDERLVLSGADEAGPAVESITEFAKMRGLSLDDARVQDWQNYTTQQQAEPVAHVLFRQDDDGLEPIMFYPPKTAPDPRTLKDRFVLKDVWLSPPPQRPWVGLTDDEILSTDPWEILRADPWMGTSDSNINPYQILLKVRTLEAKLKERNA